MILKYLPERNENEKILIRDIKYIKQDILY